MAHATAETVLGDFNNTSFLNPNNQKTSKFFKKGASRQWDGVISAENLAAYDARMAELLSPEDIAWMEDGVV